MDTRKKRKLSHHFRKHAANHPPAARSPSTTSINHSAREPKSNDTPHHNYRT